MTLNRSFWNRALALLMMMVAAASAPAQPGRADQGQYQILQARYGTAERNVDVTQRLQELARADRPFRMGNDTFGVDPDRNRVKTLRIYARGPGGDERMFEYREGSVVDGAQFSGWRGGNWGQGGWNGGWHGGGGGGQGGGRDGEYRILEARYGTAQRNVDVTRRLQELARADANFRIANDTFGVDPDRNRVKTLRIYARGPKGENRTFEYGEGSVVDGSQFSGWRGGDWGQGGWNGGWGGGGNGAGSGNAGPRLTIVRAVYGDGNRQRDVTQRIRSLVRDGQLDIEVNNDAAGGDPAPDVRKSLSVTYSVGGRQQQVRIDEKDRLRLP